MQWGQNKSVDRQLTAATVDGVNVGGRDARVDDGVKTEESSPGVAGHAPESLSGAGEKCRGNGNGGGRLHGGYLGGSNPM